MAKITPTKKVSLVEARNHLGLILSDVAASKYQYEVTRNGKSVALISAIPTKYDTPLSEQEKADRWAPIQKLIDQLAGVKLPPNVTIQDIMDDIRS